MEVPDELLLLRAVLLLRDLDLERGADSETRTFQFHIYDDDVYQSKLMTGPKLKLIEACRA